MKIGIFGGTFNPCHNGHISSALTFLREFKLDRLYLIPTFIPPHKAATDNDEPQNRLQMLRLAVEDFAEYGKSLFVSDFEIKNGGKSYSVYTVEHFADEGEVYMLCGTDMFLSLPSWYKAEKLLKMCNIVLARRYKESPESVEKTEAMKNTLRELYGARVYTLKSEVCEISSSEIRELVSAGGDISPYVPNKIKTFISEKGLYI